MPKALAIQEFLPAIREIPLVDVRSEGEFAHGHIPGATSIPLFDNTERAEIGTLYKQVGKQQAILRGLEIAGAKMRHLSETALATASNGKIAMHCWRGGMRSGSVAWLFERLGLEVFVLTGGYKAYRRLCREMFAFPWQLVVIGGRTGSQKTRILSELPAHGLQVVDLEALANHRGSAFGYAPDGLQPSQEQFENDLGWSLFHTRRDQPLFIEDESRLIGRMHIPHELWLQMRAAPVYFLEWSLEERVEFLTREYTAPQAKMLENLNAIKKRLGLERHKEAVAALMAGDMAQVCRIILDYYDRAYTHGLSQRRPETISYLPGDQAIAEIKRRIQ